MEITFKPTIKQHKAWLLLQDKTTNHILFGGSAGSGKSVIGCYWLFISCLQYPGSRYLLGRARLNNIKRTTFKSLLDIFKLNNFNDYIYNDNKSTITFRNGSEIILMDLYNYPNDPDYERLGSLEITGAFIDELSEIGWKGFQVLSSRIRYKLNEFNLIPKIFCASNPTNNWSKNYFYIPNVENKETKDVKFIQALPTDNPHLPQSYLQSLNKLDFALRQRLLYGDWNFSDDDYNLFQYEKLQQCFYNDYFTNIDDKVYITCDVADLGKDKTIIAIWRGWNCVKLIKLEKNETTEIVNKINQVRNEYKVPIANIIIDSIGVGAGVASLLKGCVRYMASNKAVNTGYKNIKTEMMYKFAEKINNLEVNFNFNYDDNLIQEAILYKKEFTGNTAGITSKDDIKKRLGRSPDIIDALYLRAYYELNIRKNIIKVL